MNERTGGIDCCFYCPGEIVAQGLCSVCLGQIDQDELSEPDPWITSRRIRRLVRRAYSRIPRSLARPS
jgi:hypothetical protein